MADVPMNKIQDLKAQGMSNNQIIDSLTGQGFSSSQIFDALSQSDQSRVARPPPSMPPPSMPQMSMPPSRMPPPSFAPSADTEELIEAIIDEKWNDLMSDINKVIAWKESTESRITKMEQQLSDTKSQFSELHKAIIAKIGEYDSHILDVGAEVKAMEKVFSKVLPVFTDNVAELSRVAEEMRAQVPKKPLKR